MSRLRSPQSEHSQSRDVPQPEQTASGSEAARLARFRYEAWQHVAPMYDDELPAASQFEAVQCGDLSREGFSYVAEQLPTAQMLVVAMGNPPNLRFFSARVVSSPTASRCGKVGYQIECEFVSKLTEEYQWNPEEERITTASSLGSEQEGNGRSFSHAVPADVGSTGRDLHVTDFRR